MVMRNVQKAEKVLERLADLNECLFVGPYVLIQKENTILVKLELHPMADGLHLAYIENLVKSGGHAADVLRSLVQIARDFDCPIIGEMDTSFGRSRKQLTQFYKNFGAEFKGTRFTIK